MYYNLLLFILINAGFSIGVSRSKATEGFRKYVASKNVMLGNLINCVMCLSFWASILVYLYVYKNISCDTIAFMFIGSFTSYFLNRISSLIQIS